MLLASILLLSIGAIIPDDYSGLLVITQDNCLPCRRMEPTINKLVQEGEPIVVVKVKTASELYELGAEATPSTQTVVKGVVKYCNKGVQTERELRHLLRLAKGENQ